MNVTLTEEEFYKIGYLAQHVRDTNSAIAKARATHDKARMDLNTAVAKAMADRELDPAQHRIAFVETERCLAIEKVVTKETLGKIAELEAETTEEPTELAEDEDTEMPEEPAED